MGSATHYGAAYLYLPSYTRRRPYLPTPTKAREVLLAGERGAATRGRVSPGRRPDEFERMAPSAASENPPSSVSRAHQLLLQPCVLEAAALCAGGCSPVCWRLQPCVLEAATLCAGGCNPVCWRLQPYAP